MDSINLYVSLGSQSYFHTISPLSEVSVPMPHAFSVAFLGNSNSISFLFFSVPNKTDTSPMRIPAIISFFPSFFNPLSADAYE